MMLKVTFFFVVAVGCLLADAPPKSINPQVTQIVEQVSADRIAAIQQKLGSFQTRNIYSSTTDPERGIGAAREWIAAQFKSYSPRLQVSFDKHRLAKQNTRMVGNVEIWNVVAVLPGTSEPERQVIIGAHYDTIDMIYRTGADGKRVLDAEATAHAPVAPGVTDDGSGTAAVMELARVMSQYQFRKTIVFVAFAAEEYGLFGSGLYAEEAAAHHAQIEGMFNNDLIGSDVTGDGRRTNHYVNVYSEEPNDSPSRELARYTEHAAERYQPGFGVNLIFRQDRFARGGDHSPFNARGYAAIRVTTASEDFANQHTPTDTFANTAPGYTVLVAKANAAAIASLSLAPQPPELSSVSPLGRGAGYDAVLRWENAKAETDVVGYEVLMRKTTAPEWEREVFVGNVPSYTMHDVNIDEVVLGVRAVDRNGDESLVTPYVARPYPQREKIATY
jgi:hypothetical protein